MKRLAWLLPLLILIAATSCNQKQEETLEQYEWLLGRWIATPEPGGQELNEKWYKESDVKYFGETWVLHENGDTAFSEKLWLELSNDTLYYIAQVSETYIAKFATTELQDGFFEVEFPENDFPSVIRYEKVADDTFIATLSGIDSQGEKKERMLEFVKR